MGVEKIDEFKRQKLRTISISKEYVEKARRIGDGNLSRGLREAVKFYYQNNKTGVGNEWNLNN